MGETINAELTFDHFLDQVCQEYKNCVFADYAKHNTKKTDYYDAEKLKIRLVATERYYKYKLLAHTPKGSHGVSVVKAKFNQAWVELENVEGEIDSVYHYGNCFIISFKNGNKYRQELPAIIHSSNLISEPHD